jgi:hypothetical protein
MDINILQIIVVMLLLFILFFGIGFILNMLLKTTWFPLYGALALIIGLVIYSQFNSNSSWLTDEPFSYIDGLMFIAVLLGAYVGGWTIKTLRLKGFRMF